MAGALREHYGLDDETRPRGVLPGLLAFVLRHAGAVLAASLALVAVSAWAAWQMPLITDFSALLPEDARSVRDQKAGEPFLGNTSLLSILVEARIQAGEPVAAAGARAREAAAALAARLDADPEFPLVVFRFDPAFFERNALLYLSVEDLKDLHHRLDERIKREVLADNPLFIDLDDDADGDAPPPDGDDADITDPETIRKLYLDDTPAASLRPREYLVDDAGTTYLILAQPVKPPSDVGYSKDILARVERHVADAGISDGGRIAVTLASNYRSTTEENDAVKRDLSTSGVISLGLLLVIIGVYFRRVRATFTIFVPLLSGVVVMAGYVRVAVGHLNTITGFCFALFMGLSIDFAIHMLARYDEERGGGRGVYDALVETYRHTGRASLAAAVTTAIGFLSLLLADFRGFHEFGIIAGGGIVICLVMIAIQLPAIIALSHRIAPERRHARFSSDVALARARLPRYGMIVAAGAVVIPALTWRATRIAWEDDFRNLRGGTAESLSAAVRADAITGRSTQPAVRLTDTLADADRLARACTAARDAHGARSTVKLCVSLADFIPADQPAKLAVIRRIVDLLPDHRLAALDPEARERLRAWRDNAPTAPITGGDLPVEARKTLVSERGDKYFMKAYPSVKTWLASNNIRFADELHEVDDVVDGDIGPIGVAVIMGDLMRVMQRDSLAVVVAALTGVLLVLLAVFRSLTRALAAYVPLVLGLGATVGLMELMDMRLGLFNMIVIPSLIGMGVDNNIHLLHRYHAEGRGSWPLVLHTTGGACMMAAVTTMAGFAGLCVAGHQGLRSIGDLAVLGITTCMLVSLLLLPAAVGVLEKYARGTLLGLLPAHRFRPPGDA